MPQDSLRSVVYRSFVTCDDPKGVVECKTIRKSKKMESKLKNPRKTHSNPSYEEEEEEEGGKDNKAPQEFSEELQSLSIMEVSRGAEKLNRVAIDSWCNANDLLRGALDLQESLVMLSKLQKASKCKEKVINGGSMELEKPRVSRDCYDELRDVIRESFARRDMVPNLERKSSDLCLDFPSSSSSQSSLIHSYSCECSPLSSVQNERRKSSPNLIAKLMGLDQELPSKAEFKQIEKKRVLNRRSSLLDIDLPRPKSKTLEEMIETMEFKGLLERKDSVDHVSSLRKGLVVEGTPIVLMRPLCVPHQSRWINEERRVKRFMERKEKPTPPKQKINVDKSSGKFLIKKSVDVEDRMSTMKTNHSKPRLAQTKGVVGKIDEKRRVAPNTSKRAETKDAKSSRTQDLGKLTTMKLSKANVSKTQVPQGKIVARDERTKRASLKPSIPKKNPTKGKPSKPSAAIVENVQNNSNMPINVESNMMKSTASEQITEEVMNASRVSISDINSRDEASSPCRNSDDTKGTNTRHLLSSSVSFLNHMDPTIFPDGEMLDDPLLLDCAKDICTRMLKPKCKVPIQELSRDISDGIEYLKNYTTSCGDFMVMDGIYSMMQRDLLWNEEVTGGWDTGWRNGYTTEAIDEVVHDIEKLVLSEFLGDVVEFMA